VPPLAGSTDSVAIVHVQTLNPTPLIEQLRKLGYQVGWPALDLDETPELEEPEEKRQYWAEVY
jgi:hypothetical protein